MITISRIVSLLVLLAVAQPAATAEPATFALVTGKDGESPYVEVSGLSREELTRLSKARLEDRQWPAVLRLVVAGGSREEMLKRLPIAGSYRLTESGIRFEPQFPLLPGRDYRAILNLDASGADARPGHEIIANLTVPKPPPGPRVSIKGVYPSGNQLPENTLRFYVHFTGPVARGEVYRHLKLVRDDGIEVKSPFLELDEELWSGDGLRLTLLFHPGRVKRELVPHLEEGPVLEAGHRYTLTISDRWEDTEGRPLAAGYEKRFVATPADDHAVDPAVWSLVSPRAGSDEPVLIRLPKPLDHALLGRLVWIADSEGNKLPGQLTVGGGERVLTFAPATRWKAGDYYLVVDSRLEDVCGNRVGEPFEVETDKPLVPKAESPTFERVFSVR